MESTPVAEDPAPGFPSGPPSVRVWQQQHESGGKQKRYGCRSVSHSGNTVLQLKHITVEKETCRGPAPRGDTFRAVLAETRRAEAPSSSAPSGLSFFVEV